MTTQEITNKANDLNSKYPNLKCEVVKNFHGDLVIKTINSDKAKTLSEMFRDYTFTF